MAENSGIDWGQIAQALAVYFGSRGESGGTPNFYNVPMTPEDKAWNDRRMALYDAGGSQQMQAVGSAAQQFMGGLPTTANPQFASPMMRGQAFAGGITLPKIDLSHFNFSAPPPGAAPATRPDTGTGGPDQPRGQTPGSQPFSPGNGGVYGGAHAPLPSAGGGPTAGEVGKGIADWWRAYRAEHPDWWKDGAKLAIAAATQQFGPMAAMMVKRFTNGTQRLPAPTRGVQDVFKDAPGTMDENGALPLPKPTRGVEDVYKDAPGTRDEYGNPPRTTPSEEYWKGYKTPYWNNPYGYEPPKVFGQTPGVVRGGRNNRQ